MGKIFFVLFISLVSLQAKQSINSETATKPANTGFYYYDDPDTNKTKTIPASPMQQVQAQMMQELIKQMKKNNELQEKILKRLEYAFPRTTPEFTINKKTGEKCISNSSADCFVMPVVPEAQNSVPVMAKMLRNPTSENVKKYIEWQAVYFNRAFKIGQGFSLINAQYEREVNKVDGMGYTQMPQSDNKQNQMKFLKMSAIFKKLDSKIGIMVFLGKSLEIEREFTPGQIAAISTSSLGKLSNITYIYDTETSRNRILKEVVKGTNPAVAKGFAAIRQTVDPKQFKRFKIGITPTVVMVYRKDDGKMIWQKLGHSVSPQANMRMAYRFLQFNNIIKPGEINENDVWDMATSLRKDGKYKKSQIDSIEIDESKMNKLQDQTVK